MKTAVSVPDEVFKEAEMLARKMKKSRSQLYADALNEYVARHASDMVTSKMNEVCTELGDVSDDFVENASLKTLEKIEW